MSSRHTDRFWAQFGSELKLCKKRLTVCLCKQGTVCLSVSVLCWHECTHVYLSVHWRWHTQGFAFTAVLVCFYKPCHSPRTAVLQPSFGSGSPGVWPPSPVLSHFGSTLATQLLWRNRSTTPKFFRCLKERCGRILNSGWLIPSPAFLGVGGPEPFHLRIQMTQLLSPWTSISPNLLDQNR